MNMIVAGSANPQNEGACFFTLEQALGALLAMAGTGNQMMASQRGYEPAAQLATGWFGRNATEPDHACLGAQISFGTLKTKRAGQKSVRPKTTKGGCAAD